MEIDGTDLGSDPSDPRMGRVIEPSGQPALSKGGSFERVLRGLGKELDRGETLTERALSGSAPLSSSGLLLLQAGIYRYTEAVDLVTKVIDRGTQAVRTTLQNP